MKATILVHKAGDRFVDKTILKEITDAVQNCPHVPARRRTKLVRAHILDTLSRHGWSGELDVDRKSAITITSVKNKIGLCFQTGNVSRIYADLLKLQALFLRSTIKAAVVLLPTQEAAREFGSNVANQERLMRELIIFNKVITIPIAVVGIEADGR
jgi:hypothetical protein